MKRVEDEDILRKYSESEGKQTQKLTTLKDFRKQFDEYLRLKAGRRVNTRSAGRPHIQIFRQPNKRNS